MSDNNDNFFDVYGQDASSNDLHQDNDKMNDLIQGDNVGNHVESSTNEAMNDDNDLFELKQRVKGMDEEAARLIQLQTEMEQQMKSTNSPTTTFGAPYPSGPMTAEEKAEIDARSIYVGNVDYSATAQELEAHFHGCGSINRVTILCDKYSGHPKGFAYIEFGDKDSVQTAMALDESLFKGRQIKVVCKRTNKPGISSTDRAPRGAYAGRGGGGPPMMPFGGGFMGGGFMGMSAPRGRAMPYPARGGYPYMRAMRGRAIKGGRGFFHYAPY